MYSKMVVIILISALIGIGCHFTRQTLPTDAGSSCSSGPQSLSSTEFNTWFETGAVSLNGAVKPANSVQFPDLPNCSFYKWSEQMFLWLTSPAPARYGGNGLVMNTPAFYDVSLPDPVTFQRTFLPHTPGLIRAFNLRTAQRGPLDLPVILESRSLRLLEILPTVLSPAGKQLVLDKAGNEEEIGSVRQDNNNRPVLIDTKGAEIQGARALLQSSKDSSGLPFMRKLRKIENFDRTSLVQKIVLDKKIFFLDLGGSFHEAEQGQADGGVLMAQNGSLVYYSLTVNNVAVLYRTMLGATVPANTRFPLTQGDLNNISSFAVAHGKSPIIDSMALAIEIKASWVEAAGLADSDKFIKMTAVVPTYDKSNPNEWVPNGTKTVQLAMVGMHVVGSTGSTNLANANHGHPELLWATFEHVSNDPTADYTYLNTSNVNTPVAQNTAGTWVFCANGSGGPFNVANMTMGGADGTHIVAVSGHTISPSDVLRDMPWGLNGTNANGNAEVISTNHIVRSLLDPADVRGNYIQTGTTWSIFGSDPNNPSSNQVGTNIMSNTTMETFAQPTNCFNCHNTNTTAVSHIFDETKPLF
ncbi:MAG TPA: hypothetical protein VF939_17190 [Puia sp.]